MGQRQLVKAFLFCSVAIGALLASPLIARADITLYEKDGFSFAAGAGGDGRVLDRLHHRRRHE